MQAKNPDYFQTWSTLMILLLHYILHCNCPQCHVLPHPKAFNAFLVFLSFENPQAIFSLPQFFACLDLNSNNTNRCLNTKMAPIYFEYIYGNAFCWIKSPDNLTIRWRDKKKKNNSKRKVTCQIPVRLNIMLRPQHYRKVKRVKSQRRHGVGCVGETLLPFWKQRLGEEELHWRSLWFKAVPNQTNAPPRPLSPLLEVVSRCNQNRSHIYFLPFFPTSDYFQLRDFLY